MEHLLIVKILQTLFFTLMQNRFSSGSDHSETAVAESSPSKMFFKHHTSLIAGSVLTVTTLIGSKLKSNYKTDIQT